MTQFEVTDELRRLIQQSSLPKSAIESLLKEDTISHHNLVAFYHRCKPCTSMLGLLKTTKLSIPNKNMKNESIPKSRKFIKSMETLRLRAKEEEYQRLVHPSKEMNTLYETRFDAENVTPAQAAKEVKSHVTTIVNIFVSVVSVAYAIWYWTETSWKIRDSYRVLLCLFFGLLILVAEVVVYLGYLNKIEEAKIKERNKKEVKTVIRSFKDKRSIAGQ